MTTTQAIDLGIRRAGPADQETVAATICAGFFDDPVTGWLLPDPVRRRDVIEPMFRLYAGAYLRHGGAYVTSDGSGVAVALPPNTHLLAPDEELSFGQASQDLAGPDADRFFQLEEAFAHYHPEGPLYYLQFLATVPAYQGRGIGSALLATMLSRADREGMPAYHEATTPRNRALYERYGYVNLGEFTLPDDGPTLWRMWREPSVEE